MKKRQPDFSAGLSESDVTDYEIYLNRKKFLRLGGEVTLKALLGVSLAGGFAAMCRKRTGGQGGAADAGESSSSGLHPAGHVAEKSSTDGSGFSTTEEKTPWRDITSYNNYYEFDTDKESPAKLAAGFRVSPWEVKVEGETNRPGLYPLEDLFSGIERVERIYRLRCVEGWSMVVPWDGYELGKLLEKFQPNSHARFVEFTTVYRPEEMPGQKRGVLEFPYVEALRLDEAMHPLTLLATGIYGRPLPGQNGAPVRLVVPWKYGFKSIKSIVKIRFTRERPLTTWVKTNPAEYGFYANVNPQVDHPRWSQAKERRIGEFRKRETLMFNGYAEHVEALYRGIDLRREF